MRGNFLGHQLNFAVRFIKIGITTVRVTNVSISTAAVSKKAVSFKIKLVLPNKPPKATAMITPAAVMIRPE
jgi:hypothetical protein